MLFSKKLFNSRKELNLSQEECAYRLGLYSEKLSRVDNVTLSRWENNISKPSLKKQITILRALGVNVFEYFLANVTYLENNLLAKKFTEIYDMAHFKAISIFISKGTEHKQHCVRHIRTSSDDNKNFVDDILQLHKNIGLCEDISRDWIYSKLDRKEISLSVISSEHYLAHNMNIFYSDESELNFKNGNLGFDCSDNDKNKSILYNVSRTYLSLYSFHIGLLEFIKEISANTELSVVVFRVIDNRLIELLKKNFLGKLINVPCCEFNNNTEDDASLCSQYIKVNVVDILSNIEFIHYISEIYKSTNYEVLN